MLNVKPAISLNRLGPSSTLLEVANSDRFTSLEPMSCHDGVVLLLLMLLHVHRWSREVVHTDVALDPKRQENNTIRSR